MHAITLDTKVIRSPGAEVNADVRSDMVEARESREWRKLSELRKELAERESRLANSVIHGSRVVMATLAGSAKSAQEHPV